jgi:hypothetical protein
MRWISNSTKALLRKVATSILPALLGVGAIYLILSNGFTRRTVESSKTPSDIHAAPLVKDPQEASSDNDRMNATSEPASKDPHEATLAKNSAQTQTPAPLRLLPLHRHSRVLRLTANFSQHSNRLQWPSNHHPRPSNRLLRPSNRRMIPINQRGSQERSSARASRENDLRLSAIELDWKKCTRSTASRAMPTKKARRSTKAKSKNTVVRSMPAKPRKPILKDRLSLIDRDRINARLKARRRIGV